jgi:lysophospholipase L1-like esterase/tetratricopeptide (TPR) repeat protein
VHRTAAKVILLGILLPAILLEIALQIAAYVVWRQGVRQLGSVELSLSTDEKRVLCIGDSYTYGYGASSQQWSYPAQLDGMLNSSNTGAWKIVNVGWPSRSSYDLLSDIERQLRDNRPQFVCILVGMNDRWQRASGSLNAGFGEFRWEWRTARLARVLYDRIRGSHEKASPAPPDTRPSGITTAASPAPPPTPQSPASKPLLRGWGAGSFFLKFDPNGLLVMRQGSLPYALDGDRIQVKMADGRTVSTRWKIADEQLCLWPEGGGNVILTPVQPRPPARSSSASADSLLAQGLQSLDAGDVDQGLKLIERATSLDPQNMGTRHMVVRSLCRIGRIEEARRQVQAVRAWYETNPESADAAETYAQSVFEVGDRALARELASSLIRAYPDRLRGWLLQCHLQMGAGTWHEAHESAEHAVQISTEGRERAGSLILRAMTRWAARPDEERERLRDLAEAWALGADQGGVSMELRREPVRLTMANVEWAIVEVKLSEEKAKSFRALAEEALQDDSAVAKVLEANLEALVSKCREHSAQAILITYPLWLKDVNWSVRRAVSRTGAWSIDASRVFGELLKTRDRSELFVPDAHCNNEGYRVLADLIGQEILAKTRGKIAPGEEVR